MGKMFAYSFLLALPLASAMPWVGPEPTKPGQAMGFTPKPTQPAQLFEVWELRKRQTSAATSSFSHGTCGFLLGAADNPLTCVNSGYSCAIDSQHNVFGCCSNLNECTLGTSCVPESALSGCVGPCVTDPYILKCNPTSPFCNQFLLVEATGTMTASNWYCDDSPTINTEFAVATDGGSPSASFVALTQSIPAYISTTSSPSSSTTSSSSSSSVQQQTTTTIIAPPVTSSATSNTGHSTPTGAIAGGVVGGIAVIAAIIIGIVFFMRKKRTTPEHAPAPGPAPSQPPQPTFVPTGGYYPQGQPVIAEKEAPMPVVQQQGQRAEMYSPPQSPAPQYSPAQQNHPAQQNYPAPNTFPYPNVSEMEGGGISPHAAPGSY